MNDNEAILFPNYMQEKRIIPIWLWYIIRLGSFAAIGGLIWLCWHMPDLALLVFWGLAVPVLPIVFWLLPGLWRNLCPLAATNQLPRLLHITFARELPTWLRRYATVIGILILFIAVPLRITHLNHDAFYVSILLIAALSFAFLGGVVFKGKSGWCGSFCPLLPVQRLYGQTPVKVVPNSYCQPCLGCTRNCYDFNPKVAYLADLYDSDHVYGADRKFFAGMMPGLLLAYFTLPNANQSNMLQLYADFGFYCLVGVGSYYVIETFIKVTPHKITAIYAIVSINIFYWFISPILFNTISKLSGVEIMDWAPWSARTAVFLLSINWLYRTFIKEKAFLSQAFTSHNATVPKSVTFKKRKDEQTDSPVVTIQPTGVQLVSKSNTSLLELLEANGENINSGCRMGSCGADPVSIIEGMEALSDITPAEKSTLERLGYFTGVRLACSANIHGNVTIDLDPNVSGAGNELVPDFEISDSVKKVVIIGNGIAGVTAADYIRRYMPDCEINLVGMEKYPLYNRMGIAKLIYGHSGMQGLMLLPENWYQERNINFWLNTRVKQINRVNRKVTLATGETLDYDRLIITMGSRSFIPPIENAHIPGCFALREADDAMNIRDYIQSNDCRKAIIAGGGLLGLEAAYALLKIGMHVTVLERSEYLLTRQLDELASKKLLAYLEGLGLHFRFQAETVKAIGNNGLTSIRLKDGKKLTTDLLLVAAGISPNIQVAEEAGLKTNRGVLVNNGLQTSDENIYAAGDIAELSERKGQVPGLWTVAVDQGKVAALNAIGDKKDFIMQPTPTVLKVVGIDLTSIGQFNPDKGDEVIVFEEENAYRKLVVRDNIIVGAILLGCPQYAQYIQSLIQEKHPIDNIIERLRQGDWTQEQAVKMAS